MNLSAIPLRPSIRVQRETLTGLMNALGFAFESRRVIGSYHLQEWAKIVTEDRDVAAVRNLLAQRLFHLGFTCDQPGMAKGPTFSYQGLVVELVRNAAGAGLRMVYTQKVENPLTGIPVNSYDRVAKSGHDIGLSMDGWEDIVRGAGWSHCLGLDNGSTIWSKARWNLTVELVSGLHRVHFTLTTGLDDTFVAPTWNTIDWSKVKVKKTTRNAIKDWDDALLARVEHALAQVGVPADALAPTADDVATIFAPLLREARALSRAARTVVEPSDGPEHTDACRKLAKAVESFDSLFNPQ